jgi:hypothetical protein
MIVIREYELITDYREQQFVFFDFCHKKSASGVYSQGATNETNFLMVTRIATKV